MIAGGCVCHRAEPGRGLVPALSPRRPHMTALWEPTCQGAGEGVGGRGDWF